MRLSPDHARAVLDAERAIEHHMDALKTLPEGTRDGLLWCMHLYALAMAQRTVIEGLRVRLMKRPPW